MLARPRARTHDFMTKYVGFAARVDSGLTKQKLRFNIEQNSIFLLFDNKLWRAAYSRIRLACAYVCVCV